MKRGGTSITISRKIKREITTNKDNVSILKNTLETSIKRINENTTNITKNQININGIGCALLQSLINFKQKDEIITDASNSILDLTLTDTYTINMDIKDGIFKPFRKAHYFLSGSFEVNNTTKKHKLLHFCLYDEYANKEVFAIKQTLIGGFNTISFSKMFKLLANPAKTYTYSFRAKGEKLKINNIDFNLFRINGTMA